MDKSESKEIIADKNLSQVCFTDKSEPERVIANKSSTEERESERIHKSINKNEVKYAIGETEYEEPLITDNPVINESSYFNLSECGKNFLNNIDATYEWMCMATLKGKYYSDICNTLTGYNDRKNTPLSNANIR